MSQPTRRIFLKTALSAIAPLILSGVWAARQNFWFLHTPSGAAWPVDDPVIW